MTTKFILLALAFVVLSLLIAFQKQLLADSKKGNKGVGNYRKRSILTDNEAEFFGRLVAALPEHYIFPQVSMQALLEAASADKKTAHIDRLKIAQHRVDYVVCNKQCEVIAVVELDDKTHSPTKDQVRDSRLKQAGIRTVRFQSKSKPNKDAIRSVILGETHWHVKAIELKGLLDLAGLDLIGASDDKIKATAPGFFASLGANESASIISTLKMKKVEANV